MFRVFISLLVPENFMEKSCALVAHTQNIPSIKQISTWAFALMETETGVGKEKQNLLI